MARTGATLLFYALALVGLYYMSWALYTVTMGFFYGLGSYTPEFPSYNPPSNFIRYYERPPDSCYDLWSECTSKWPDWLERMGMDPSIWWDGCTHIRQLCERDMRLDTAMPSYGHGPGHRMRAQDYV